jgi:GT2 family glycosyltransferase
MFSIIIPSFNPKIKKICATLESIFQNSGDYEVILVLQKTSTFKQNEIKKFFYNKDNFKIIVDLGVGISRARNIAIKESRGEWFLLLDDDVYIKKNVIKNLNNQISEDEFFYYGNALIKNTNINYVNYYIKNSDLTIWSYNRVCSISLIINRKTFNHIGTFDECLGTGCLFGSSEESDLIIRALLSNIRIKYIKNFTVYHDLATHSLNKTEAYAMGSGAMHRKHLYSGKIQLYIKFILDLLLRLIFLLSFRRKRFIFIRGFLKGFLKYANKKKT